MKAAACLPLLLLAACSRAPQEAPVPRFTETELEAKYYADLGAPFAVVGSYPKKVQQQYQVFLRVCSQCHGVSRALYSDVVRAEDWRRYVRRMHERGETREWWISVPEESFDDIVAFLTHDAKERKVARKAEFDEEVARLKERYRAVEAERARLQNLANEKAGRTGDYTGVK